METTRIRHAWSQARHHQNGILFVCGFLFDALTIIRIDAWLDLGIQLAYLLIITALLVLQSRKDRGLWKPGPRLEKLWGYSDEALYFVYGGLFSCYVVLYFKSTSGIRTYTFFVLLATLLFINEIPRVRRLGYRLRMGFYAFCWSSFLIYFVPILAGRMGDFIFLISMALSFFLTWKVAGWLISPGENYRAAKIRLFWPAGTLIAIIMVLYFFRLIPPVPLSVQYQGIFHNIEKRDDVYDLKTEAPPFYLFWRKDSRPYRYTEGEAVYYFVRIFAPGRFRHDVRIRWEKKNPQTGSYENRDYVSLQVTGGRSDGFRGYVAKSNFEEGRWRVSAETEDGRTIGMIGFNVEKIEEADRREWRILSM